MSGVPSQRSRKPTGGSVVRGSTPKQAATTTTASARSRRSAPRLSTGRSERSREEASLSGRSGAGHEDGRLQAPPSAAVATTATSGAASRFAFDKHYKSSVKLRSIRGELLRVRGKLQRALYEKYGGRMDKLLLFFDSDHDGEISLDDFLKGVREYHWPLTKPESLLIFAGIDEDGSQGLDFAELVNVFEPASLGSGHASASEGAATATEDLEGFVRFTPEQVANIEALDQFTPRGTYKPRQKDPLLEAVRRAAKVNVTEEEAKRVCGGLPPLEDAQGQKPPLVAPLLPDGSFPPVAVRADGRVDLSERWTDGPTPVDPELKRPPETEEEEANLLKKQIAGRVRRRGADFFAAWRRFDEHDRGFLNQQQFVGLCGPKGFDLGLSRRGMRVLLQQLSDEGGAIEPLRFDAFLKSAGTDHTTGDAMRQASLRGLRALRSRIQAAGAAGPQFAGAAGSEGGEHGDRKSADVGAAMRSGSLEDEDEANMGLELNRTAKLLSTLPASSHVRRVLAGSPAAAEASAVGQLHPSLEASLGGPQAMERQRMTVAFGPQTDTDLDVAESPRFDEGWAEQGAKNEARSAAKAVQQLRYAQAALGISEADLDT